MFSAAPSSSLSSPAPAWGHMSPSHGLQFFTSCSSMGPFHGVQSFRNGLLQHGSPQGHKPCQKTCSSMDSSLHETTGPGQEPWPSSGSQPSSGIPLLHCGVIHQLQVEICSTVDLHGLQGHSLPHYALFHGLHGNLCSSAWSTSSPPSALALVSAELFLSHILTFLSYCCMPLCRFFFPSELCYHRGSTTVADGLGLGQQRVHLRAGWHWLCQTQWKLLAASHRSHPCSPKPCHTNPVQCPYVLWRREWWFCWF